MNNFCSENELQKAKISYFQLFFYFDFFHVFLVKVLKLSLIDQNINMHVLYKKIFQS